VRVIGGGDNQTVRCILFEKLKKRVEYPPDLTNIVPDRAITSERVDFIKKVYAASLCK